MLAEDVQRALNFADLRPVTVFSSLQTLSRYIFEHGATDKHALDAIIRLREMVDKEKITDPVVTDAIYSLCREAGLFPYLPPKILPWRDRVAVELFRGPGDDNFVFHREQWQAFQILLSGKSLILSAPTSFGKSILIQSFIAQQNPGCVVIVVPTIALLDQFRRKYQKLFSEKYLIITRNDQIADSSKKRIYILTQERLLDRTDIEEIDLLAIDEYYKLDEDRESKKNNNRVNLLNAALRKHLYSAKQIFFLGPTVAKVVMKDDLRPQFTDFPSTVSTVTVDVHNYKDEKEPYKKLAELIQEYKTDKSLIYSKSPPAAGKLAKFLALKSSIPASREVLELADWLAEHYHPSWNLVGALRAGYGLHHGSIPRSVAQILVRYFNEGSLNALICTSTLIEGVNTAAKNVFVLDKQISTTNYDYFDFKNIAGRSGRMGHHLIGRIFLFNEPPAPAEFEIKVPALADDNQIPDGVLINLPDENLSESLLRRKQEIFSKSTLPKEIVQRFAPYGIGSIENVSQKIAELLIAGDRSLIWSGYKKYKELLAVFSVAWPDLRFNKKRLSAESTAFYASRLRGGQILRSFFDGLVRGKDELEHTEIIERGFRALGIFDYSIPKLLVDMQELVNHHCKRMGIEEANYLLMAQMLDNYCTHHWIKALDEYGVPIPLGKKIEFLVRDSHSLEDAVDIVKNYCQARDDQSRLTLFERALVTSALE